MHDKKPEGARPAGATRCGAWAIRLYQASSDQKVLVRVASVPLRAGRWCDGRVIYSKTCKKANENGKIKPN